MSVHPMDDAMISGRRYDRIRPLLPRRLKDFYLPPVPILPPPTTLVKQIQRQHQRRQPRHINPNIRRPNAAQR